MTKPFLLCRNGNCPISSWCKRFTYANKVPYETDTVHYVMKNLVKCPDYGYENYLKNKHREIYERENPDDILRYPEYNERENQNNNREPRVRENHLFDFGIEESMPERSTIDPNSVLQFFPGGDPGGTVESYRSLETEAGVTRRQLLEYARQVITEQVDALLQDDSRDGVSFPRVIVTESDNGPTIPRVR